MNTLVKNPSVSNSNSVLFGLALAIVALIGFAFYFYADKPSLQMVTHEVNTSDLGVGIPAPPMPVPTTAQ